MRDFDLPLLGKEKSLFREPPKENSASRGPIVQIHSIDRSGCLLGIRNNFLVGSVIPPPLPALAIVLALQNIESIQLICQ